MNKIKPITIPETVETLFSSADLFVTFFFLIVLIFSVGIYGILKYRKQPRRYFLTGFCLKTLVSIVYVFLIKFVIGGDTMMYFTGARQMAHSDWDAFKDFMLTLDPYEWKETTLNYLVADTSLSMYFGDISNNLVSKIAAIPTLFLFDSYTSVTILFGFFAFLGCWKIYKVSVNIFPKFHRYLAWAILFFPSTMFWGNGISKDSICLGCLGFMIHYMYRFVFRKKKLALIGLLLFSYIVFLIKIYIVIVFYFALITVLFFKWSFSLDKYVKVLFFPLAAVIIIGLLILGDAVFLQESKYSLALILDRIQGHQNNAFGGSSYDLGEFESTLFGLIKIFPIAIGTALFRPFLFDIHSAIVVFPALENFFLLVLCLVLFFKIGLFNGIKLVLSSEYLFFCFVFTIVFSGFVGLATYNLGTLSRYRIPCMPFFLSIIAVMYGYHKEQKQFRKYRQSLK